MKDSTKPKSKEPRQKFKLNFIKKAKKDEQKTNNQKMEDDASDGGLSDYSQSTLKRADSDSDTATEDCSTPKYTVRHIRPEDMVKRRSKSVTPPSNLDCAQETPPRHRWTRTRNERANSASRANVEGRKHGLKASFDDVQRRVNGSSHEEHRRHTVTVSSSDVESIKSNSTSCSSVCDKRSVYEHLASAFPAHSEAIYGAYVKKNDHQVRNLTDEEEFRRNCRARCSLPVVKSTNKTLERPLGLVLLTCRSETKRATLPNEVTSMDTVRALFVRSFPSILSMSTNGWQYRRIYILDHTTNVYYELENVHDIHDRSVLKVVEVEPGESYPTNEPIYSVPHKYRQSSSPNYGIYATPSELGILSQPQGNSGSTTPTPRDPQTQARMASMEAQLAHLTAWVQTAVKPDRPSSNCSSMISDSEIQPTSVYLNHLMSVQKEIQLLKSEQEQLKEKHLTNVRSMHDLFRDSFNKIQTVLGGHQCRKSEVEKIVDKLCTDKISLEKDLTDLELCVEEIRSDVLKHKCRVNLTEVSKLAIGLSGISKRMAEMKIGMPDVENRLKDAMTDELQTIVRAEKFITDEPDSIEKDLKRCKKVMTILSTLKRLASAQRTKGADAVKLYTRLPSDQDKKTLFNDIKCVLPNHEKRMETIRHLEASVDRRKRIIHNVDRFEKSLEVAQKHLRSTDNTTAVDERRKKALSEMFKIRELPKPVTFEVSQSRGGRICTSTPINKNQHVTFSPAVTEISKSGSTVETRLKKVPPPPPPRKSSKLIENENIYSRVRKRENENLSPPSPPPPALPPKSEEELYHSEYHKARRTNSFSSVKSDTNGGSFNHEISTLEVVINAERDSSHVTTNGSKPYSETEIF